MHSTLIPIKITTCILFLLQVVAFEDIVTLCSGRTILDPQTAALCRSLQDIIKNNDREKRFLRFGRALTGDLFLRFGRRYPTSLYNDKRFLRFGRDNRIAPALLQNVDIPEVDEHVIRRRSVDERNSEKSVSTKENNAVSGSQNGDVSSGKSAITGHATTKQKRFTRMGDDLRYQKRFMRFGRDVDKRFMRFGRQPDAAKGLSDDHQTLATNDKRFMRFGRAPEIEKRFMRFGRDSAKRFMRFGRTPDIEKRFMRFGRAPDFRKRFMRFGRSPEKRFMRFGRSTTNQQ